MAQWQPLSILLFLSLHIRFESSTSTITQLLLMMLEPIPPTPLLHFHHGHTSLVFTLFFFFNIKLILKFSYSDSATFIVVTGHNFFLLFFDEEFTAITLIYRICFSLFWCENTNYNKPIMRGVHIGLGYIYS